MFQFWMAGQFAGGWEPAPALQMNIQQAEKWGTAAE